MNQRETRGILWSDNTRESHHFLTLIFIFFSAIAAQTSLLYRGCNPYRVDAFQIMEDLEKK